MAQESPGQTRMVGSLGDGLCVRVVTRVRMKNKAGEETGDKGEYTLDKAAREDLSVDVTNKQRSEQNEKENHVPISGWVVEG